MKFRLLAAILPIVILLFPSCEIEYYDIDLENNQIKIPEFLIGTWEIEGTGGWIEIKKKTSFEGRISGYASDPELSSVIDQSAIFDFSLHQGGMFTFVSLTTLEGDGGLLNLKRLSSTEMEVDFFEVVDNHNNLQDSTLDDRLRETLLFHEADRGTIELYGDPTKLIKVK